MSTGFRGPLRYNAVGGAPSLRVGSTYPYLNGCGLTAVNAIPRLPVLADEPRFFGVSFNGSTYPGPYAVGTTGGFTLAGAACTVADVAVLGSAVRLATAATDELQAKLTTGAQYQLVANRRIWFSTRVALTNVVNGAFLVGLIDAVPADISALPASVSGIFFHKADAATSTTFRVQNTTNISAVSTPETLTGGAILANNVPREYGFLVDATAQGAGAIHGFVDGKLAGSVAVGSNTRPSALLALAFAVQAEGTNICGLDISHALCLEEI